MKLRLRLGFIPLGKCLQHPRFGQFPLLENGLLEPGRANPSQTVKTIRHLTILATMAASAFAADIALKDGRLLRDATVRSQSPRSVIIKHAGGLSSVAKGLLPSELQALYPADEAAGVEADRRAAIAAEAEQARRNAEAQRRALLVEEGPKIEAAAEAARAKEAARQKAQQAILEAQILAAATGYFENDYDRDRYYERTCQVKLTEVRTADGGANRWFVTGQAVIRYLKPAVLVNNTPPPPNMSAKQIQRAAYDARYVRTDIRNFEAYYSADGEKPSIDVTLR
jgi:hypothetical protein